MSTQKSIARQDTNHGEPVRSFELLIADAGSNNTWRVQIDANDTNAGPRLILDKIDSAGARLAAAGSFDLKLAEIFTKAMSVRELKAKDANGNTIYFLLPRTAFYSAAVTGSPEELGGGGGASVSRYRVKSIQRNYLTCRTWDGSAEGATDICIAKPFKLRRAIAGAIIDGVNVSYTYDAADIPSTTRIASNGTETETQIIVPRYLFAAPSQLPDKGDEIFAVGANTGLVTVANEPVGTAGGQAITLLDLNIDGRAWARKTDQ